MVKDELYYSLAWRVLPPWAPAFSAVAMTTGTDLLYLAETCLDEERVNVLVPKIIRTGSAPGAARGLPSGQCTSSSTLATAATTTTATPPWLMPNPDGSVAPKSQISAHSPTLHQSCQISLTSYELYFVCSVAYHSAWGSVSLGLAAKPRRRVLRVQILKLLRHPLE